MAFNYRGDEKFRMASPLDGDFGDAGNGALMIPNPLMLSGPDLGIIFSDGEGWEHVSVSTLKRPPTWAEMCAVKRLFWDDEDCVMQLHPPKSQYVNFHPHCLHLWRPTNEVIPQPPTVLVGPKS